MDRCGICSRELGTDDPLSLDCGGDCLGCIRLCEGGADENHRVTMRVTGVVVSLDEACMDHCTLTVMTSSPSVTSLTLKVPEDVGAGYLADEWHGTFTPGRVAEFNVYFDLTSDDQTAPLEVVGFKVGDYQRGSMV